MIHNRFSLVSMGGGFLLLSLILLTIVLTIVLIVVILEKKVKGEKLK